ncbi:MAG: SIS domain-containing protein, partial [Acidobacteriia bacterium]|nr:SIS domain-containing protein [Terriglobia bacterium]
TFDDVTRTEPERSLLRPTHKRSGRSAKGRGATVLALTGNRQSPLAKAADGVFLARGREESRQDSTAAVMQLAAMHSLAVVAARVLKRPSPQTSLLEGELQALPDHVEWALTQLPEAVRSFVGQLFPACAISLVAGGLYYPAALLGARVLRSLGGRRVRVLAPDELAGDAAAPFKSGETIVVLAGSRSPLRKQVRAVVEKLQRAGVEILAISDHNEAEVTRRARLAVLLPNLSEQVGSIVALVFLDWVAGHLAAHPTRQEPPPPGA